MGLATVTVMGHCGNDLTTGKTQAGVDWTKFSLAVGTGGFTEDDPKNRPTWFQCICYGGLSRLAEGMVKKGSTVLVNGSLRSNYWNAKDGRERSELEISVRDFRRVDRKFDESAADLPFDDAPKETPYQGAMSRRAMKGLSGKGWSPDDDSHELLEDFHK